MEVAFGIHIEKRRIKILIGGVVHTQHERGHGRLVRDNIASQSHIDLAASAADNPVASPASVDEPDVQIGEAAYDVGVNESNVGASLGDAVSVEDNAIV